MTQGEVLAVFQEALLVAMKISAPLLIASIAIGLVVAIFQAATQIHEQTLTFVPKVLVIALMDDDHDERPDQPRLFPDGDLVIC